MPGVGLHTLCETMKNKSAKLMLTFALMFLRVISIPEIASAQDSSNQTITVAGDANACELNAAYLDNLIIMARESKERVFVVAHLGKGETSRYLIHRRLHNARTYLRRLAPESVVITEGERVDGQGRVEFFLGSKLIINALVSRNGDLCVDCCEALEHYYGWGKKDNRRRQRQLESLTPQPNKSLKGTRD